MHRGGDEAIQEMNRQANELLVEQLGSQMKELFSGLAQKQEEDNKRLRGENLAIRKQMVELEKEKVQQNGRMEQLMTALLGQMRGDQSSQGQPASPERTPARSGRTAVVVPEMPGTHEKQARPGILAQQQAVQWMPARHPCEDPHFGGANDSQEVAEERRRSQAMEAALKDVLTKGEGAGMLAKFMQARGHGEVVGMIASGGVSPSMTH